MLLGPNGAGKTSTIECCVGLRSPSAGTITVLGASGAALHTADHRSRVGVMLQDGGLPTGARPLPLLRHLASLYAEPLEVDGLANRLMVTEFAGTSVRRLSGGQRQRLALAAALVGRPRLVFLDEPTAGLDPRSRLIVRELLSEQCAQGVAVVLTTHDLDEAARLAHRVIVMDEGQVVADATPAELTAGLPRTLVVTLPSGVDAGGLASTVPGLAWQTGTQYRATGPGIGLPTLADATRWCLENGYDTADLALEAPSLEDVVLGLTGRGNTGGPAVRGFACRDFSSRPHDEVRGGSPAAVTRDGNNR